MFIANKSVNPLPEFQVPSQKNENCFSKYKKLWIIHEFSFRICAVQSVILGMQIKFCSLK